MAKRRIERLLLKGSNVPGKIPSNGDLELKELAINFADVILYASGTTTGSILPIGWDRISRTGDTMSGDFSAPTISATTYQNLPTDSLVVNPITKFFNGSIISGGTLSPIGGVNFSISEGSGLAKTPSGKIINISWPLLTGTTATDGSNFLTIDYNGNLIQNQSFDEPNNVKIGFIFTSSNNSQILGLSNIKDFIENGRFNLNYWLRSTLGSLVETGCALSLQPSPDDLKINLSSGVVWTQFNKVNINQLSTFTKLYKDSTSYLVDSSTPNTIDNLRWNNTSLVGSAALATMTDGYYKKDVFLIDTSGKLLYAQGREEFENQIDAEGSPLPVFPDSITRQLIRVASVIIQKNNPIPVKVFDIRPIFSRVFDSGVAASLLQSVSHSDLLDLDLDTHLQYHNDSRGDIRYYTKTNNDILLSNKANLSGATFSGDVSAPTISATTYLNLPITNDTFVTGGTYSNGITTFRNNSGNTFDVSGFSTISGETNSIPFFNTTNTLSNTGLKWVNNNLGLGSAVNPGELFHIGDGNILLEGGGEVAQKFKRDFSTDGSGPSGVSVNPIFQIGRIIQAGDGDPEIRIMYSDDNTSERTVFEVDRKGIVASVKTGIGSHFEGFKSLTDENPMFRLNSYPNMRLEMGSGGSNATDVAVERNSLGGLSFYTNFINKVSVSPSGNLLIGGNYDNEIDSLQVSGSARFNTSIVTPTISATTYLNLPITNDTFVTGGTYNSGTAVFTNSTGGTFNISGFNTINNHNDLSNIQGGVLNEYYHLSNSDYNKVINLDTSLNTKANLSGATFSGGISAPTISATTIVFANSISKNGGTSDQILLGDGTLGSMDSKQATLVSGTNIKTLNSTSLLGSGNISVATSVQGTLADNAVPNTRTINSLVLSSNITLTTGNISDSTNKRYVTDSNLVILGNTSGTNTGDNAVNSNYSSLVSNATHTGDAVGSTSLTVVRINGQSLASLGTGLLKNTTTTGVPSIAINSDLPVMSSTVGGAVPTPPNDVTKFLSGIGTWVVPPVTTDATLTTTDITTNNFSTTKHGFVPKGTNVGNFLKDDGTWAAVSGGGGSGLSFGQIYSITTLNL